MTKGQPAPIWPSPTTGMASCVAAAQWSNGVGLGAATGLILALETRIWRRQLQDAFSARPAEGRQTTQPAQSLTSRA